MYNPVKDTEDLYIFNSHNKKTLLVDDDIRIFYSMYSRGYGIYTYRIDSYGFNTEYLIFDETIY